MMNSGTVDQVQAALAAFLEGKKTLAELEAVLGAALQSGLWTPAVVMDVVRDVVGSGRVPPEALQRLGLCDTNDATTARTVETSSQSIDPAGTQPSPQEPIFTGKLLAGRYRLERKLGEGGMGIVYQASDQEVEGEIFAVKVLGPEIREQADALELLREEVRKTRLLAHPNIVGVYSLNVDRAAVFILMECLEGKTLQALLDEDFGRGMPFDRAWPIIEDVGAALAYAHDHSVIHGDLKPSNVFVTTSGKAKLFDFGIARAARGSRWGNDTAALAALTPAYASCEMLEYLPADTRDDIYAFACVIYEVLSGRHPFGDQTAVQARDADEKPTPIASLTDRQNVALAKGLAFDRAARTATVETLLAGLAPKLDSGKPRVVPFKAIGVAALIVAVTVALAYFVADRFWFSKHVTGQPPTPSTAKVISDKSIAILPFADLSERHDQEFFANGMAEEIINLLVKVPRLKVIGRTSSFSFKGKSEDLRAIGSSLGVAYLVEGSVSRANDQIRVTAQLIDTRDGVQRWSETYDRKSTDVLKVQGDIAQSLVHALQMEVATSSMFKEQPSVRDSGAYDAYLHGLHAMDSFDQRGLEAAVANFRQAIHLDPTFAPAAATLALCLVDLSVNEMRPVSPGFEQARAAAQSALDIDSNSALAHAELGEVHIFYDWDWQAALNELHIAQELEPNNTFVLDTLAEERLATGRSDEAIQFIDEALVAEPLRAAYHNFAGQAYLYARRFADAEAAERRALAISSTTASSNFYLGIALLLEGKPEEALMTMKLETPAGGQTEGLALVYHALHQRKDAEAALTSLEAGGDTQAFPIAEVYAFRGQNEKALHWLERAYLQKDALLWMTKADPLLRGLENDIRYKAFLRKMDLPQ